MSGELAGLLFSGAAFLKGRGFTQRRKHSHRRACPRSSLPWPGLLGGWLPRQGAFLTLHVSSELARLILSRALRSTASKALLATGNHLMNLPAYSPTCPLSLRLSVLRSMATVALSVLYPVMLPVPRPLSGTRPINIYLLSG